MNKNIFFTLFFAISITSYAGPNEFHQKPTNANGQYELKFTSDKIQKVKLGMNFALRFQGLEHDNNGSTDIDEINPGFTNANGNASLEFELTKGMSSYIEIYLSSEHHTETYMREGYMFIDHFNFLNNDNLDSIMKYFSVKAGQMEINYGDYHLRRSDNGEVSKNPLIGNYLIDTNTTEIATEIMFNHGSLEALLGLSGGTTKGDTKEDHGFAKYAKLAWDKRLDENLRFRISGSYYRVDHSDNGLSTSPTFAGTKNYLYSGNRSGSPYKSLFGSSTDAGQIQPEISQDVSAYQLNSLIKLRDMEFFITYERAKDEDKNGSADTLTLEEEWEQYAIELKYNFTERFYGACRYNTAKHLKSSGENSDKKVKMAQIGLGYKLIDSILMKIEYMNQKYDAFSTGATAGGEVDGYVIEFSVDI